MKIIKRFISAALAMATVFTVSLSVVTAETPADVQNGILLDSSAVTILQNAQLAENYEGFNGTAVITKDESVIEYSFEAHEGDYVLEALYYPVLTGSSSSILRSFSLGTQEDVAVSFVRCWVDDMDGDEFTVDSLDNQIRPTQIQEPKWLTAQLYDNDSNSNIPIIFHLSEGMNTLKVSGVDDSLALGTLSFIPYVPLKTYEEVKKDYEKAGYKAAKSTITLEAERSYYKSDCTVYPNYERSSSDISPNDAVKQRVNVIGGDAWKNIGQYVVWQVKIPESGLYAISLKYLKNANKGLSSYRRLYIDGTVPFSEANGFEFPYTANYKEMTLKSADEPYLFYLEKGTHEIKLEVCLGAMSDILEDFGDSIYNLNSIYRRIIVVTGTSPDQYRDYEFETILPDVIEDIGKQVDAIQNIYDRWFAIVGEKGSTFSTLDLILKTLRSMKEDPENIAKKLSVFKTYIGSCGTLLNSARSGILQLDTITVYSPEDKEPSINHSFFRQLWFSLKSTLYSFVTDYNAIGTMNTEKDLDDVRIWVSGGREQYELLKNMTNDGRLEKLGVKANLQLTAASLLQTIVAGIAPDVVLTCTGSTVIEYALRGALQEFDTFDDFDSVKDNYDEECFVPLTLENHIYAIPTVMSYNVLFYRKDILSDMGLVPPQTWDDVTRLITILNKSNLEFGLPSTMGTYFAMLNQGGGSIYNKTGSKVLIDTQLGVDTFIRFTRYFTDYGQPITYEAQNRFRTGEMPLVISDYTFFNTLSVAAPEIAGLWDFTVMPGTKQEDGTIAHTSCISVTGTIMTKQVKNKEAAWKFIKWWTGADVQTDYGRSLESILGASSRYGTANLEALANMPWTSSQKKVLLKQLECSKAMPQVPGDYLVDREFSNAYKLVVNEGEDAKDSLLEKVKVMNSELSGKRREFGLKTAEEEEEE